VGGHLFHPTARLYRPRPVYDARVRKNLTVEELGDLLDRPFNATLATYRRDGSVLLSPVWHEWRDGGFSIFTGASDLKVRHVEQQGRAAAVVSDNDPPFRGIEVSGTPTVVRDAEFVRATFERITRRCLGDRQAEAYMATVTDPNVVIRLEPGRLRTWDFADDDSLRATTN
jgi:PPOX class probable F420-dependent enzyme